MKKSNYSVQCKQDLIHCYENLRNLVLKKSQLSSSDSDVAGHSILLFRGMSAWINTFLSLELVSSIQAVSYSEITTNDENQFINFSSDIHEEVTMILTNMVLSHQQNEPRSQHYV